MTVRGDLDVERPYPDAYGVKPGHDVEGPGQDDSIQAGWPTGRCGTRDNGVRSLVLAAVLFVLLASILMPTRATAALEWNLPTLMATMRQVRASTAHFVETKYLRLLNQAQHSSGRLIYAAPDHLRKETTEPSPESMTIAGDRLTIERPGDKPRTISLRDYSEIGALVESIRATLAGDLSALTNHFTATLDGGADNWALNLTPREPKLRELVTMIRIKGQRATIREIETLEADGDRSDIAISPDSK